MMRRLGFLSVVMVLTVSGNCTQNQADDYPIQPVPYTAVTFQDRFWALRMETNRMVTIPSDFRQCEETGRISNFAKAGGLEQGAFQGIHYDDSDVFKVLEGAAYSLAAHPDPELERYCDDVIRKIVAAQEPDGYLYTARTIDPANPPKGAGTQRWERLSAGSHELYNVGHMYEAAVAYYQATGKRKFLDVAIRNAELIVSVFGPGKLVEVPGHQEIELALVKLYRITGNRAYLECAQFFLDARGGKTDYNQNHQPAYEQRTAVGHAVRAQYMYTGMTDIAALTGDARYLEAIEALWNNVTGTKQYITGGVGAVPQRERFGDPYELPNETAYNETCAAIANALWNHRMFLLYGHAKYIDVLERVIYNGFLSGIGMDGDTFFYPNPLAADGVHPFNQGAAVRQPWFRTACCPVNVVRFIPSIAGFVYAVRNDEVFMNLFAEGQGRVELQDGMLILHQKTAYPWEGAVQLTIESAAPVLCTLALRIPGWASGNPMPGGLYRYMEETTEPVSIELNGAPVKYESLNGYAQIRRTWKQGDVLRLNFPMPIRRVLCHDNVVANRGRVALERGPIVYCVEGVDHGGAIEQLSLADALPLQVESRPDLLGGVTVIRGENITAIPYYAWAHRGATPMVVWLPRVQ